jgi:hypothetical protein
MNTKLEKLTRKVAVLAEQIFNSEGAVRPYFYGQTKKKRCIFDPDRAGVIKNFDDKEKTIVSGMAELLFALFEVDRYVYIAEAWMLWADNAEEAKEIQKVLDGVVKGVRNHPKRIEVVTFQAEDIDGNSISGYQSIIRPAGFKSYLDDDLTLNDSSEWQSTGRFTHLLEFRKHIDQKLRSK